MAATGWYIYKANQCGEMAEKATTSVGRASYKQDQKLWLEIAARLDQDEQKQLNALGGGS
jgi:hypothetical protein